MKYSAILNFCIFYKTAEIKHLQKKPAIWYEGHCVMKCCLDSDRIWSPVGLRPTAHDPKLEALTTQSHRWCYSMTWWLNIICWWGCKMDRKILLLSIVWNPHEMKSSWSEPSRLCLYKPTKEIYWQGLTKKIHSKQQKL